jgi:hypothetical protein
MADKFPDASLIAWADFLRDYAEDWDAHFKPYGPFFTQEYWYLLVGVTEAYWGKIPLIVAGAKSQLRGLIGVDDKTKDARIKEAIDAKLIVKLSYDDLDGSIRAKLGNVDRRYMYLVPTTLLERQLRSHLSNTLRAAIDTLQELPQKKRGAFRRSI